MNNFEVDTSISECRVKIASFFTKYEKLNHAIEVIEEEGFSVQEKIYGKRDYYLFEVKHYQEILEKLLSKNPIQIYKNL